MTLVLIVVITVIVGLLLAAASALRVGPREMPENPNANNPDAFEADLDPEGDEPEEY